MIKIVENKSVPNMTPSVMRSVILLLTLVVTQTVESRGVGRSSRTRVKVLAELKEEGEFKLLKYITAYLSNPIDKI